MARINFSYSDKAALAKRVANRCSFPGCTAVTSGPSDESTSAVSNSGTACHIISASQGSGARRNIPETTPEEIMKISNGIWMCATHGRIIDNDEVTYSVEMLQTWRIVAEFRAKYEQEHGKPLYFDSVRFNIPVVEEELTLTAPKGVNSAIGELLIHCCVPQIWGSAANDAVRDLAIEIVINAFIHGNAQRVTVSIVHQCITVTYEGAEFDSISQLTSSERGGGQAMRHVLDKYGNKIVATYEFADGANKLILAVPEGPAEVLTSTPCSMTLDNIDTQDKIEHDFARTARCTVIYVVLPRFFGRSDMRKTKEILGEHLPPEKRVVFVAEDISEGVAAQIREEITGAKIIRLQGR